MRRPTPLAEQLAWWRNAIETGDHHRSDVLISLLANLVVIGCLVIVLGN